MCHLVALLSTALLDSICNLVANSLGLDDVVAAVDLGQVLAFNSASFGSLAMRVSTLASNTKNIDTAQG